MSHRELDSTPLTSSEISLAQLLKHFITTPSLDGSGEISHIASLSDIRTWHKLNKLEGQEISTVIVQNERIIDVHKTTRTGHKEFVPIKRKSLIMTKYEFKHRLKVKINSHDGYLTEHKNIIVRADHSIHRPLHQIVKHYIKTKEWPMLHFAEEHHHQQHLKN
jgi:hypothetical protein